MIQHRLKFIICHMNKLLYRLLFLFVFCCFFTGAFAQNVRPDFGLWSFVEVEKKLSKKWDISAEYDLRLKDNLYQLRNTFVEIKITRDLPQKWKTSFMTRGVIAQDRRRFRLSHTLNKSMKFKAISFKYRLRHDVEWSDFSENLTPDVSLRNRIGVQYKRKKSPLKSAVFVEIKNDYEEQFFLVDNVRFKAQLKYKIIKELELTTGFIMQRNYHVVRPVSDRVIVLGLSYKL